MTIINRSGIIIVPRPYTPDWSITIGGIDVSEDLLECTINRLTTEGTGNFSLTIINFSNQYVFSGMETVIINADFGAGTTKFFEGKVEDLKNIYEDITKLKISGRHISGELASRKVTEVFTNTELSNMFTTIIDNYSTGYTTTGVNTTTVTDSISFIQTPFYDALKEIAFRANFDYYIDDNKDFKFFSAGSIINNNEAISPANQISVEGIGSSIFDISNRITVYGTLSSGPPIIHTIDNTASQDSYGIREMFISDSRISSIKIAEMIANAYLTFKKDKFDTGTVTSYGLPTLKPGDKIYIELRTQGISGQYRVSHITDKISPEGWYTTVSVERLGSVRLSNLLKNIFQSSSPVDFKNSNAMKYSFADDFDDSTYAETTSNITIANSEIKQTTLGTNGIFTSTTRTATSNITQVEVHVNGQDLAASTFEFSNEGGKTWTSVVPGTLSNLASVGLSVKFRITLVNNATNLLPIVKGISFLYK